MPGKYRNSGFTKKLVLAAALLPALVPVVTATAAAAPSAPPFEPDANSAAPYSNVVFYDANGNQVTSGTNDLSNPFAYAVGTTTADAGAIKANLAFTKPVSGTLPALWTSTAEAGPTNFSSATALPAGTPADIQAYAPTHPIVATPQADIQTWIPGNPTDTNPGYADTIQVRLTDSRQSPGTYWESDIAYNNTGTATVVDGVTVPPMGWAQVFPIVASTTTSLSPSATGVASGDPITLNATVSNTTAAGIVQFFDGGTLLGSSAVSAGKASYSYSPSATGTHNVTATFVPTLGDETGSGTSSAGMVGGSTGSSSFSVTAAATATTTSFGSSPTTATVAQPVIFTATVSPAPDGGTVAFTDTAGAITSCAKQPVNTSTGDATCTVTYKTKPASGDTLTATYSGDTAFKSSAVSGFAVTVAPASTSVSTPTASANPAGSGQSVTYSATVSPIPDGGTVSFGDGTGNPATTGCASQTVSTTTGVATCTVTYPTKNTYSVTATYNGDSPTSSYNASAASTALSEVINTSTSTALTSSPNPSVVGQGVTYTATVSPAPDGGTVTFKDGSTTISACAPATPDPTTGIATCFVTYNSVSGSPHSVTATYSGDTNFAQSASTAVSQAVDPVATTTKVTSGASVTPVTGQPVSFTATVTPATGSVVPTGSVSFTAGGQAIAACTNLKLTSGQATCSTGLTAAGSPVTVKATYTNTDGNFTGSSGTVSQTVAKASTTTALTSSENPGFTGKAVTYTATVSVDKPGSGTPTGTVAFSDGTTAISGCATKTVTAGKATCTVTYADTAGSPHSITATYSGDSNFAGSSAALSETVDPAVAPTAPTGLTATAGDGQVTLAWSAPASAGTFPVSGYDVFVGTAAGKESATPANANPVTGRSFTVTGLSNDTKYFFTVVAVSQAGSSPASNEASATPKLSSGYLLVGGNGQTYAFGVPSKGSAANLPLAAPIVGAAETPDHNGYWLVGRDGGVFTFGDAHYYGSEGGKQLAAPVVGIVSTADGHGYWLIARDGGVFTFGDAHFVGSMGGKPLAAPIVGAAATPSGNGYYLVGRDGGVFTFGDAHYLGSMGGKPLAAPVVAITATPDGRGYAMAGADGGMFTFGTAHFYGSFAGLPLAQPIVALRTTSDGGGYVLVAGDGGVFTLGNARFLGSEGGKGITDIVSAG